MSLERCRDSCSTSSRASCRAAWVSLKSARVRASSSSFCASCCSLSSMSRDCSITSLFSSFLSVERSFRRSFRMKPSAFTSLPIDTSSSLTAASSSSRVTRRSVARFSTSLVAVSSIDRLFTCCSRPPICSICDVYCSSRDLKSCSKSSLSVSSNSSISSLSPFVSLRSSSMFCSSTTFSLSSLSFSFRSMMFMLTSFSRSTSVPSPPRTCSKRLSRASIRVLSVASAPSRSSISSSFSASASAWLSIFFDASCSSFSLFNSSPLASSSLVIRSSAMASYSFCSASFRSIWLAMYVSRTLRAELGLFSEEAGLRVFFEAGALAGVGLPSTSMSPSSRNATSWCIRSSQALFFNANSSSFCFTSCCKEVTSPACSSRSPSTTSRRSISSSIC